MSQSSTYINSSSPFPTRPAFFAKVNAQTGSVTGDGTVYTVVFNETKFDTTNSFDTGTGIYTIPTTGKWVFTIMIDARGLTSSHTSGDITLATTQFDYFFWRSNFGAMRDSANLLETASSIIAPMDAGDTASVELTVRNGGLSVSVFGTNTGSPESMHSVFAGFYLG